MTETTTTEVRIERTVSEIEAEMLETGTVLSPALYSWQLRRLAPALLRAGADMLWEREGVALRGLATMLEWAPPVHSAKQAASASVNGTYRLTTHPLAVVREAAERVARAKVEELRARGVDASPLTMATVVLQPLDTWRKAEDRAWLMDYAEHWLIQYRGARVGGRPGPTNANGGD